MSVTETAGIEAIDRELMGIAAGANEAKEMLTRFEAEVAFAQRLGEAHPEQQVEWDGLILDALRLVKEAVAAEGSISAAVAAAEAIMAPIGAAAKEYTVYCAGHAHIDMNWMWNWPETVALVNDTFTTVNQLMEEFPTFHYSQSQTSVYQILKDYLPWQLEMVKRRVAEGRWEITANHWVEGEKNLASGEALCRQVLYTKRFFKQEFGLPYDAITIDFEPDTFGHAHTIPGIIAGGGVKHYYFCRTGPGPHLFWWQGKDGSRVLAFDDLRKWYNNWLDPRITQHLLDFEKETGLKDYLFVYGVGDHGGGPTRMDIRMGMKMNAWPIFPNVKLSSIADFFAAVEPKAGHLPVIDAEMNFIFEGCYTAQSNLKRANRRSECAVTEAETFAVLGKGALGMPYPAQALFTAWRHTMFNQFHDILPGSCTHNSAEYAQGLFQEIMAQTSMVKTHTLRSIAAQVNTSACSIQAPLRPRDLCTRAGQGLGAGFGDIERDGAVSRRSAGAAGCDPFVIFNPNPWPRTEVVTARIWNRAYEKNELVVKDDTGSLLPVQYLETHPYWWMEHEYIDVAFPVTVPALGYRAYAVARSPLAGQLTPAPACSAAIAGISKKGVEGCPSYTSAVRGILENAYLRVEVEQASGAIVHLIDKRTGIDLVPEGKRLGLLEYVLESPAGMSAWHLGQPLHTVPFTEDGMLEVRQPGPYLGILRSKRTYQDSTFTVDIALAADAQQVEFTLEINWLERGTPETGMPTMRIAFPLAVSDGVAAFECPNGHVTRPMSGSRVPAQKWVDITGAHPATDDPVGATLLNDCTYGYSVHEHTIYASLLRSSYDPDPLPEMGAHTFRFALRPHVGAWTPSDATRAGLAFNLPMSVLNATEQTGTLPASQAFAEILTANVMISSLKKAEDSDALIVRLYEMDGKAGTAQVRLHDSLAPANAPAIETDLLEQPLATNTADLRDGVLNVTIPAFGTVTVKIG